jgi:hypothetical protein
MPCKDSISITPCPFINSQLRFMYFSFRNPWKSEFNPSKINVQPCCRRRLHVPCPSCVTIDATSSPRPGTAIAVAARQERPMEKTTPPSQDFARCWWPLSNPCRKLATSREGHVVVIFYMSDSALHQTSFASDAGEPISVDLSPLIILICQLPLTLCSCDLCTRSSSDHPMCMLSRSTLSACPSMHLEGSCYGYAKSRRAILPTRHSQELHYDNC